MGDFWDHLSKEKVCHVVLEVSSVKTPLKIVHGALIGIGKLSGLTALADVDVDYIWLGSGSRCDQIEILSTEDFTILSINVGIAKQQYNDGVHSISYSANAQLNLAHAKELYNHMKSIKDALMDGESDLIDVAKYSGIPNALKESIAKCSDILDGTDSLKASTTSQRPTDTRSVVQGDYHHAACGYLGRAQSTIYASKKVSTSYFKRTTKYPITAAIEAMRKKVEALEKGVYKPPSILLEDDGTPEKTDTNVAPSDKTERNTSEISDLYEDYFNGMGMC